MKHHMSNTPARSSWKLPKAFMPYVFAFYMAGIMALLMCAVIVGANAGLGPRYLAQVLEAYTLAMPVAFVCVIFVRPLVARLVLHTVRT
jgi:hypothetical protein